ncbi:hypothetical protein ACFQRC_03620 [Enterovirga sp. GCM10030262]|uniref:hypothetical protein n=1 Tax=Enterovirga sp. GCM10030262 TaxID=3273391 RepID=UPI00360A5C76
MNLYAYVGGDPVNLVDPPGTGWWPSRIERKVNEDGSSAGWGFSSGGSSGGGLLDSGGLIRADVLETVLWERAAWFSPTTGEQYTDWKYTGNFSTLNGAFGYVQLASYGGMGDNQEPEIGRKRVSLRNNLKILGVRAQLRSEVF